MIFDLRHFTTTILVCVATTQAPAADTPIPAPLLVLQNRGYSIGKSFDAGHGLTGWLVTRGSDTNLVYTTEDRQVLIIGSVLDGGGHNLTQTALEHALARPDLLPVYQDLAKATFIAEGQAGQANQKLIYVVFDPNCPYCSAVWKELRPYVGHGVELRWVPVAYLRPNSANKAAAILDAASPVDALRANESGFDAKNHQGGIPPASTVSDRVTQVLKDNDGIMNRLGSTATPTLVWKDSSGDLHTYVGLPSPDRMIEIVGVPH